MKQLTARSWRSAVAATALVLVLAATPESEAQEVITGPDVLKGLTPIVVLVGATGDRSLRHRLQVTGELTLRSAGIDVLKWNETGEAGMLWILLNGLEISGTQRIAFLVQVEFQTVAIVTGSRVHAQPGDVRTMARVWGSWAMTIGRPDDQEGVVDQARALVEKFANDYLKANPKD